MLSTDNMSISKGLLNAHLLPCRFQIMSTLIYLHVTVTMIFLDTELCTKTLLHLINSKFNYSSGTISDGFSGQFFEFLKLLFAVSEASLIFQKRFPDAVCS